MALASPSLQAKRAEIAPKYKSASLRDTQHFAQTTIGPNKVNTVAHAIARISGIKVEVEALNVACLFCGTGLLLWLLIFLTYGIDLSPGFF